LCNSRVGHAELVTDTPHRPSLSDHISPFNLALAYLIYDTARLLKQNGSTENVVGRGSNRRRKGAANLKFSISSPDRFDLMDGPAESFRSGVGLFMVKYIADA